jgi:XTP/dITP diphosphohydrolase
VASSDRLDSPNPNPARQVVLASGNAGKQREFAALLGSRGIELVLQSELGIASIAETGTSFEANALLKARHAALASGLPALADDSGLQVDALGGRPGIHSARYAGESASDQQNNAKLLEELRGVAQIARTASFRCVLVLVRGPQDAAPLIAYGSWPGAIATAPAGERGFGYDPLFLPQGLHCSAAQLSSELKNRLSHRSQALAQLLHQLARTRL